MHVMTFIHEHALAVSVVGFFVAVFLFRQIYWRFSKPVRSCETCARSGPVKRVVRGAAWIETPILMAGLSVGLVVHLLLFFSILVFTWRTLGAYLICPACGSERLS